MNLVDSSAWIAYFRGERNAAEFSVPILHIERLVVPSIILAEVFRFFARHLDERSALEAVAQMQKGLVIPLESHLAITAGQLGLDRRLPLADSIIYATAKQLEAVVWTQDADFKNLPGVKYFP